MSAAAVAACRLCGARCAPLFRQTLLARYDVAYFACPTCELLQTEEPYWLAEAHTDALTALDTGAVRRCEEASRVTALLAISLGVRGGDRCLDFGAGTGLFVRSMRDLGYDFRWWDRHAANIYARGFEGALEERHRLVTALEVWEHLDDVAGELDALFRPGPDAVLVSTVLHRRERPGWWYYMQETGQHVSFFAEGTMQHIAARYGYVVSTSSPLTLFVRGGARAARVATARGLVRCAARFPGFVGALPAALVRAIGRTRTHTDDDFELVRREAARKGARR